MTLRIPRPALLHDAGEVRHLRRQIVCCWLRNHLSPKLGEEYEGREVCKVDMEDSRSQLKCKNERNPLV